MIKSKFDNTGNEVKLKNKFHYLFDELSVESKKIGEFHNYSRTLFPTMMFFDLLWYLKTNEFIRDGSWIDMTTVDPKFSGLQIKFF